MPAELVVDTTLVTVAADPVTEEAEGVPIVGLDETHAVAGN